MEHENKIKQMKCSRAEIILIHKEKIKFAEWMERVESESNKNKK